MECYPSELQRTLFFPLMLLWVVAMVFGTRDSLFVMRLISWFGIVVGVVAALTGLRTMFGEDPTLTLTESGINDKRLGVGLIPWSAISSVSAYQRYSTPLIELWLADESIYIAKMPRWKRIAGPIAKATGHSPFVISTSFLTPGFRPVYEYILRFVPAK